MKMNQKEKGVEVHDTPGQWFRTPVVHPMKRNSQEVRESQRPRWHGNTDFRQKDRAIDPSRKHINNENAI